MSHSRWKSVPSAIDASILTISTPFVTWGSSLFPFQERLTTSTAYHLQLWLGKWITRDRNRALKYQTQLILCSHTNHTTVEMTLITIIFSINFHDLPSAVFYWENAFTVDGNQAPKVRIWTTLIETKISFKEEGGPKRRWTLSNQWGLQDVWISKSVISFFLQGRNVHFRFWKRHLDQPKLWHPIHSPQWRQWQQWHIDQPSLKLSSYWFPLRYKLTSSQET